MQVKIFQGFQAYQAHLNANETFDVSETVRQIITTVQQEGDTALRNYTQQFDKVSIEDLRVPETQLQASLDHLDPELRSVLTEAIHNVRVFHERQKTETQLDFSDDGTVLGWKVTPIEKAGLYVPGGRAVYPSTMIMNVVPAQVAGVSRLALVSPPGLDGLPSPLVLATAALLEVNEVYRVGGAQAVAALAYGTESIAPVYKITGPGNAYVTEAKRQVFGIVGIDSIAGPSEILILCNREDIPNEYIVRDMLSQAEHDPLARAILVTTSTTQAEAVAARLKELVPTLPRHEIIEASFDGGSAIITVDNLEEAFGTVNDIAPEHLELLTASPMNDLHRIHNAGAIFLGPNTPEPVGDYFAGPNHTLPTSGCAKFSSPLGVQDFLKTSSVLSYSSERLQRQGPSIMKFAQVEELFAHAEAVRVRLK